MPFKYIIRARIYCGHTLMISPRQGADPIPTVINQLLDPGYMRGPDGKETSQPAMYVQCGREDCQCSVPLVSTALEPADEETRLAVKGQKETVNAQRRAASAGNDPAFLRVRVAELELATAKARIVELENDVAKKRIAELEAQVAAQKPAPSAQVARR